MRSLLTLIQTPLANQSWCLNTGTAPWPDPHDTVGYESTFRALCGAHDLHTARSEILVAEIELLLNAEVPVSLLILVSLPLSGSHEILLGSPHLFHLLAVRGGNDGGFRTPQARYASTANLSFVPFLFLVLTVVIVGGQA